MYSLKLTRKSILKHFLGLWITVNKRDMVGWDGLRELDEAMLVRMGRESELCDRSLDAQCLPLTVITQNREIIRRARSLSKLPSKCATG